MKAANPYIGAYPWLRGRRGVWGEIARFVARDTPPVDTVVELGAGYCDFINQFPARIKIAFDLNPEARSYADPGVRLYVEDCTSLREIADDSVDLVFASNFLEHLTAEQLEALLPNVRRVLRKGGRLILLQPNHLRCAKNYFDATTHKTIFDHLSIRRFLERQGLRVTKLVPGQLPFSMKSRLPKWRMLTRLYLRSPWRPFAKQMYVVAARE